MERTKDVQSNTEAEKIIAEQLVTYVCAKHCYACSRFKGEGLRLFIPLRADTHTLYGAEGKRIEDHYIPTHIFMYILRTQRYTTASSQPRRRTNR
jgi:hypothetical protein